MTPVAPTVNHGRAEEAQQPEKPRTVEQYATVTEAVSRTILLHVVPITVIATNGSSLSTYGLLDNASRGTIIRSDVANSLGLKGQKELVSVNTVMEKTNEEFEFVNFQLQSARNSDEMGEMEEISTPPGERKCPTMLLQSSRSRRC